jgi:hypothetical protein
MAKIVKTQNRCSRGFRFDHRFLMSHSVGLRRSLYDCVRSSNSARTRSVIAFNDTSRAAERHVPVESVRRVEGGEMELLGLADAVPPAMALVCWFESYSSLVDHPTVLSGGRRNQPWCTICHRMGILGAFPEADRSSRDVLICSKEPEHKRNLGSCAESTIGEQQDVFINGRETRRLRRRST